ncbi:MAG: hypothetical protein K8F25_15810, partial [Fimbriimonadaceae bacterium]|nr:hypothetical protein [Alphaproteobacteria bacterium]
LEDLSDMVKNNQEFVVYEAKSGDDITRSVLTQIIFEQENKGENLLPIGFLRQLIGLYDDNMSNLVPSYLEFTLGSLVKEQDKIRKQLTESWGANPFEMMQDQVQKNMAAFEQALSVFNPFVGQSPSTAEREMVEEQSEEDGFEELKDQLSELQLKLDKLSRKSS